MRAIITAGGTGGHIYPAIAIINKILKEEKDSEILYIGTLDRMEKDIIPRLNIKYVGIDIKGLKRKITIDNFKNLYKFEKAKHTCKKIIKEFNPDIVIGTGGYVTAPVIWAAKKLGKKTFIHEQNSSVGLSNKYLTKYADKIGVSFESALKLFPSEKVVYTGNPCSENAIKTKSATKKEFNLTEGKKLVLIVMGSLGSSSVNEKISSYLRDFGKKDYEVLFVTGKEKYSKINKSNIPSNVKVTPYIDDLPRVMKISDVIITRAGATTMSEIIALAIPSIFIPSPYVTNNHQYKNAISLVDKKAGVILEEDKLTKDNLLNEIDGLLNNSKEYNEIKSNLKRYGVKDSSTRIYEILKDLMMSDKRFY